MSIAVAVLLFLISAALLFFTLIADSFGKGFAAFILSALNVAGGVLNIVSEHASIHLAVGVLMVCWAFLTAILFGFAARRSEGGIGVVLVFGAFVLFVWTTTFAVLQLTIVV